MHTHFGMRAIGDRLLETLRRSRRRSPMSWMSGRHRNAIQVVVGLLLAGELALASAIAGSPAAMPQRR